ATAIMGSGAPLAAGSVAPGMLADMPPATVLGRAHDAPGAGPPQALDAQALADILDTLSGDPDAFLSGVGTFVVPDYVTDVTAQLPLAANATGGDIQIELVLGGVTNDHLADVPADTVKARLGAAGSPDDVTLPALAAAIGPYLALPNSSLAV